jgi:acetyl esterase/lipase
VQIRGFRPVHLDLHVPPGPGHRPVIAWIHGGAFWEGSRLGLPVTLSDLRPPAFHDRLLARGYAVADLDYRLSGEAVFPAQIEDVAAALAWLAACAGGLGLDVERFATWGESAGAALAALAALDQDSGVRISAVVDWYGRSDFTDSRAAAMMPGGPIYQLLDGGRPEGLQARARAASPLHQVHAGAPPFLIMHGTADTEVPYFHSEKLAAALRAVGVRADLVPVEGASHVLQGVGDIGHLVEASLDFLDEVLPRR